MFLPLLCLGAILAPTCPASYQPSCSPPPSSGSVGAAWFHPFSRSTTAPIRGPAPRPPLFTVRVGSHDEVVAVSHLKACTAADATPGSLRCHGRLPGSRPGGLAATKQVLFLDPLVSSPSPSSTLPCDSPGTVFLPGEEVFARPGPTAHSQPPQTQYPFRQQELPKRLDLWPLLLPAEVSAYFHRFEFNDNCRAKTFIMSSFPKLQVYD